MSGAESYSGHSMAITRLVERAGAAVPLGTVPAALVLFGPVPYLLTGLFFLLADGPLGGSVVVPQLLAAGIAAVGPVLIRHYDERVFPTFVDEVGEVVVDRAALVSTVDRFERFFATRWPFVVVPWTVLILAALLANFGFFADLGVAGPLDPAFLVYLLFAVWWSTITGVGLHGALTTVLCVRAVGDLELTIDPLHPDGLGGLGTIGYFSIRATLLNSIGSFALPLAFAIAAAGNRRSLVFLAVGGYVAFIVATFAYPTVYVNRRAQAVRDRVLREKRERIRELERALPADSADGELPDLETQLRIQTLREDFHEYRSVSLYPLSVSIITRLASSVLLPIAFTLLETYVFTG